MRIKTVIVAESKTRADAIAKAHKLKPWQWRYAFNHRFLQGLDPDVTILVQAGYNEDGVLVRTSGPEGFTSMGGVTPVEVTRISYPMHEALRIHRSIGGEVVWVSPDL